MKGMIFDIKRYALHDGPGIRQTVFFKGCSLRCRWCHNPESQSTKTEIMTRELKLDGYSYCEDVSVGRMMTVDEVMAEVMKETIFYDESGGGVTFSGGEPLLQAEFLKALAAECRRNGIHTVLDTCGYAAPQTVDSVADLIDLFLFDVKLIDEERHVEYAGVSNRVILENLRRLASNGHKMIIRLPIIPGTTDTDENIKGLIDFLHSVPSINEVDLLPYHSIANHKYRQLEMENKMKDVRTPTDERMNLLKGRFEQNGFSVKIGG